MKPLSAAQAGASRGQDDGRIKSGRPGANLAGRRPLSRPLSIHPLGREGGGGGGGGGRSRRRQQQLMINHSLACDAGGSDWMDRLPRPPRLGRPTDTSRPSHLAAEKLTQSQFSHALSSPGVRAPREFRTRRERHGYLDKTKSNYLIGVQ